MSLSITKEYRMTPISAQSFASRAGALRAARRENITGFEIEEVAGRHVVRIPVTNADKDADLVVVQAEVIAPGVPLPVVVEDVPVLVVAEPAKVKAVRAVKAKVAAAPKGPTKKAQVEAMLRAALHTAASMATALNVSERAVVSLIADVKRAGVTVTTVRGTDGARASYQIA
jgi:hypothetical protein